MFCHGRFGQNCFLQLLHTPHRAECLQLGDSSRLVARSLMTHFLLLQRLMSWFGLSHVAFFRDFKFRFAEA